MSTPWWITVITIGATGTFTLLTQWLTTSLSNRQAQERMHIELNHSRRVDVYEELGEGLRKLLHCLPDTKIPLDGPLFSDNELTILTVEWPKMLSGVDLIASATVRKHFHDIGHACQELLNINFMLSNLASTEEFRARTQAENGRILACARQMREAMRKDLGNLR